MNERSTALSYIVAALNFLVLLSSAAEGFVSERGVLVSGMAHRYDLRVLRVQARIDSLNTEAEGTRWLPQASLSAGFTGRPHDSVEVVEPLSDGTLLRTGSLTSSAGAGETLSVEQHLPGGGSVGAALSLDHRRFFDDHDSTRSAVSFALNLRQPLLRDAWANDPVARTIRIARLDNERFTLQRKKELLSHCSDIRVRFWRLYEAQILAALYRTELKYAREQSAMVGARFTIGIATSLDTLNARLQLVNATAQLHDAESDELQLRDELAYYTGMLSDSSVVDTALQVGCTSLPAADEFLRLVEEYDPQLRVFEVAAKRLEELSTKARNSLLPRLDLALGWEHRRSENNTSGAQRRFGNSVIGLIASYSFPLRSRKLEIQGVEASMEKNDLERRQYREELLLRIGELSRSWERELRAVDIAMLARELAAKTFAASREGFAAGTVDRLSLDKADSDYREACVNLLKKQLVMKQLEIVFDEMTGTTLSRFGVELQ